ncbi:MAG: NAD(P)-dependent oxidoreductase [Nitrospirae bacterium]|nr:NAD(P)-dependent oxidoreductase [Nitrospirota bacterium]
MKVLITGASGFIGSHLAESLLSSGCEVSCLVRSVSARKWLEGLNVQRIHGDCSDRESLNNLRDFEYVFHLSGLTKSNCKKDFYTVNTTATENIIDAVVRNNPGIKRFVYVSSLSAFGPNLNGSPVSEDRNPRPVSDYGKSKLLGEAAVLKYKDTIPVSVLRPTAVYGPRDSEMFLLFKLVNTGLLPFWGKTRISLVYVEDLVRALILTAEKEEAIGETFCISDGMNYSNVEIIDEIASALQKTRVIKLRLPKTFLPVIGAIGDGLSKITNKATMINRDKIKELMHTDWRCDISNAKNKLGFTPKVGIKEGIKWTADWYKIHRWL